MNELVFVQNESTLTNSLLVAEKFKRNHRDVLESIRNLLTSAENSAVLQMFVETQYVNEQGKELPMFVMNRDGFTLLAMGFNGKKAMKFKLDYIAAFNAMEKALKEQAKPKSREELLVESAQLLLEQSKRLEKIENRLDALDKEREENTRLLLEAKTSENGIPNLTLRDNIRQLVNRYASSKNISQGDVWHKVYDQLYYLFHISISNYKKIKKGESKLAIAERNGFLNKIYDIISNMVRLEQAA